MQDSSNIYSFYHDYMKRPCLSGFGYERLHCSGYSIMHIVPALCQNWMQPLAPGLVVA